MNFGRQISADEAGATAVEYGLIVALIAVVIIFSVAGLGTKVRDMYEGISVAVLGL